MDIKITPEAAMALLHLLRTSDPTGIWVPGVASQIITQLKAKKEE